MAKKQVEGRSSKQAPANRTVWTEYVVFIATGSKGKMFTDVNKFNNCVRAGREVTAYYYREGASLLRGKENVIPRDTLKHIATIKRNCKDFDKKLRRINNALENNGKGGVTISF